MILEADPNFRVAKGVEQARSLLSSLFTEPGPKPKLVYGIADIDALERLFVEFSLDFGYPARLAANIHSRCIYTSIKGHRQGRSDERLLRESRFLTPEQLGGCADLTIIGDTVVFMTYDPEVVAQAVTSALVAAQMTAFFTFLWDHAAP